MEDRGVLSINLKRSLLTSLCAGAFIFGVFGPFPAEPTMAATKAQATGAYPINLPVGGKKLIALPEDASRIALANNTVASATPLGSDHPRGPAVLVEGLSGGETSLLVWSASSSKARAMTLVVGDNSTAQSQAEPSSFAAAPSSADPIEPLPEAAPEPVALTATSSETAPEPAPVAEPAIEPIELAQALTPTPLPVVAPITNTVEPPAFPSEPQKEAPFVLEVSVGFQKVISLPALPARVAIGDPSIASVTPLKPTGKRGQGAGVMVTGLKTGSTSLFIWDRGAAQARVMTISVVSKSANTISNLGELKLDNDGQVQRLSGEVSDLGTYQQARESLLKGSEGEKADLIDTATLSRPGAVQLDVKVVEFTRTELQNLGIDLARQPRADVEPDNDFQFQVLGGTVTGNAFNLALQGVSDDFDLALRILQSNGYARVLAEPSLVAQSGTEASFLAGGEVPIVVPSNNGSFSIEYKEFGVGLVFKPTILSDRTIALNVAPEVSDLDFNRGVNLNGFSVPAIVTRRASTTVELGEKQTFVIGGLISRRITANAGKVPWLADLPIIGGFFKRNDFSREDKELLITVTPHFVKPRDANAPAIVLPGADVGTNPRGVWQQFFYEDPKEPVPGFRP